MSKIREPIKKTSIAKKEKIIEKGFELMCSKGYHNVTCIDIAHYAEVSTGIIYQYFKDKRDIFLSGTKDYANKIMFPMLDIIINDKIDKLNLKDVLSKMIDSFIKTHTIKKEAHEELMAMTCLDKEVAKIFTENELKMTKQISELLVDNGFNKTNIEEKVHIATNIIDNYCHEVVYHKHKDLDYTAMKEEILNIIVKML